METWSCKERTVVQHSPKGKNTFTYLAVLMLNSSDCLNSQLPAGWGCLEASLRFLFEINWIWIKIWIKKVKCISISRASHWSRAFFAMNTFKTLKPFKLFLCRSDTCEDCVKIEMTCTCRKSKYQFKQKIRFYTRWPSHIWITNAVTI